MARLNITKQNSYNGKYVYYTIANRNHRVPDKLTKCLTNFKVIGKRVFVPSPTAGTKPTPDWPLVKIQELMVKHGKSATLKSVMAHNQAEKQWVLASDKQEAEYRTGHAKLEAYVTQYMVKHNKQKRDYQGKQALANVRALRKQGIVSAESLTVVEADIHKYLSGV